MLDITGIDLTETEKEMIAHPSTGGVILFARNYYSPEQVSSLVDNIRACRKGPLLIAVDQEGGRVQRFKQGFSILPPASYYNAAFPHSEHDAIEMTESAGWLMAAELISVGIDFSFAPVLDIEAGISQVIGDRAFAANKDQVCSFAAAFRNGMKQAGMAAVGKHFPGHGSVALDSHLDLPKDPRTLDDIRQHDLVPFWHLIQQGLEAVMTAHILYPEVDDKPATYSQRWVSDMLRQELGFNGVVFSDDLNMGGAAFAATFGERASLALGAGCDMVLICNNPDAAADILDYLPIVNNLESADRLVTMLHRTTYSRDELFASARWQQTAGLLNQHSNNLIA
ncbi:MAG: beta-N-acetylhexosaminidase [Gammaproteobacteria bacterium]|nr:beta-N-acetylhexosaminidase [Gammaproteobacteria bacterium]